MATTDETAGTAGDKASNLGETVKSLLNPLKSAGEALDSMVGYSNQLNKSFGLSRARIEEMNLAFVDSAAGVERLGGSLKDVVDTMAGIAAASRRNVIENEDVIAKLYASSKVLGISAESLVEHFKNVGYETRQIGPNLEKSVEYIQSVGLNASTVMKDVSANMEKMNRYQFEGGVAGLSKMAAQASMLRFDMKETFGFADRMLTPENAINMASAFQRLGVTAGNLVDPFVLMNESINDPTGLQNSLARLGQEFTYFDEETKSFKINPQGVLTLRQMEEEAHLATGSLSKSALAAADLDKRLSEVSGAGLKFANEEDKQYLANIAKMGEGGKYEVELKDGVTKELQNLNQDEFDALIEQQKKAPKDMESIARSQLGLSESLNSDVRAIRDKMFLGAVSSQASNIEGLRNVLTTFADKAQKMVPESPEMRKKVGDAVADMQKLVGDLLKDKDKLTPENFREAISKVKDTVFEKASSGGPEMAKIMKDLASQTAGSLRGNSQVEQMFKELALGKTDNLKSKPLSRERVLGSGTTTKNYTDTFTQTKQIKSQVDFGGTITIDVKTPSGVSQQEFKTYFESEEFKKKVYEYYNQKAKELEK